MACDHDRNCAGNFHFLITIIFVWVYILFLPHRTPAGLNERLVVIEEKLQINVEDPSGK